MAGDKHREAREHLEELIQGLRVGDALPPERALAADVGISRMTLRRAIEDLVAQGLVVRRHGAGTFVGEPKIAQPLTATSFSEDMRSRGFTPGSRTLELDETWAGPRLGHRLQVSPGSRVLRVRRLRLADGEPMAIETLHVPLDLVPGLAADDLEDKSFYALLARRHGIHLARATQTIEPTVTDEVESQLLGRPLHSPSFLFERTSWDERDRAVEFVRSIYRGDRYKLTADLPLAASVLAPA